MARFLCVKHLNMVLQNLARLCSNVIPSVSVANRDLLDMSKSELNLKAANTVSHTDMVIDKNAYTVVKEGKAEILFPSSQDVFYNPVQEFNRDLSVLVVQVLSDCHRAAVASDATIRTGSTTSDTATRIGSADAEDEENKTSPAAPTAGSRDPNGIRVLEALAASGLRSCRFAMEVSGLRSVLANDISAAAVEAMRRNARHNGVQHIVEAHQGDASMLMYGLKRDRYDVVDLDPYGSPAQFLDSAVQAVTEGGILQVTCTDMGVLCGASPETCHSKYGALSIRTKFCHELALRIVLQTVETLANRHGRYIEPLLSVSVDFYIRMFIRVRTSAAKVKLSVGKMASVYLCHGCESWRLLPKGRITWNGNNPKFSAPTGLPSGDKCPHCSAAVHVCGPIWTDPIHNVTFVRQLLQRLSSMQLGTSKRIEGVLSMIEEELPDAPLFYHVGKMSSVCRLLAPPILDFRSALLNGGHRVSGSQCCASAVKTDAPPETVWDIMRAWDALHPANRLKLAQGSPASCILSRPAPDNISFTRHPLANPESRRKQLCRFQLNPEPNWGPKARAKNSIHRDSMEEKRSRNQGKRRKPIEAAADNGDDNTVEFGLHRSEAKRGKPLLT